MKISSLIKLIILFGTLTAILALAGYFISGISGAIIFASFGIFMNLVTYWFSDKIAIAMSGAKFLPKENAPEIYNDIEEVCQKMSLPVPKIYITKDLQPNAFATGRNPKNSAIAVTQGLLKILDKNEVKAVLAHELAHIKNRDVLIATIAAVMAGIISSIANIAIFFPQSSNENRNPVGQILFVVLAPIAAFLVQMAISRSREFEADKTAAFYTKNPKSLANALIKIEESIKTIPNINANPALSSLFIQNPFSRDTFISIFSTHPPVHKRVQRLMSMQ